MAARLHRALSASVAVRADRTHTALYLGPVWYNPMQGDHMKTDTCSCGGKKDKRARSCRQCFLAPSAPVKRCTLCNIEKPLALFRIRTRKNPRPRPRCRDCEALSEKSRRKHKPIKERCAATRRWEKRNPNKVYAQRVRTRCRAKGLNEDDVSSVEALIMGQEKHSCHICGVLCDRSIAIDHCHKTNRFRGLLCKPCNNGLGHFQDDTEIMQKAIIYLKAESASL